MTLHREVSISLADNGGFILRFSFEDDNGEFQHTEEIYQDWDAVQKRARFVVTGMQ